MKIEEGKVYEAELITRLYCRNNWTEQENRKFFEDITEWSKEKIEEEIKRIYESSLEELEEEVSRGKSLSPCK